MTSEPRRPGEHIAAPVLALLVVLLLGPALWRPGFLVVADMTFVPDQPWKPAWLGLDGSVPRAVPADAVVWALDAALPGSPSGRLILPLTLWLAGLGVLRAAGRCFPSLGIGARLAAAVLYVWNPFVFERLAIGHWGLLMGYAALPWVLAAALDLRAGRPGGWPRLLLSLAAAAAGSPTGGLMTVLVAIGVAAGRPWWRPVVVGLTGVVLNLPWLLPGLLSHGTVADPDGATAFAAAADTPYGVLGSLLSLGGIWKAAAAPGERERALLAGVALLVSLAALVLLARRRAWRLLALAAVALAVAWLPVAPAGRDALEWLIGRVPGAGLLRDSQKWLMPLALVVAVGFAGLVGEAGRRWPGRRVGVAVVAALLPLVLLPSLAWGLSGRFDPVRYPADWFQVRALLERQPADELRTAVLPWSAYQRLPFNGGAAALDPAIRFFPGQVVTATDLDVGDLVVAGDDPATAPIGAALGDRQQLTEALRAEGVRFVLLHRTAAGAARVVEPAGAVLFDGPELRLLDLDGSARPTRSSAPALVVAGDVLAVAVVLGAGGGWLVTAMRRASRGDRAESRRVR